MIYRITEGVVSLFDFVLKYFKVFVFIIIVLAVQKIGAENEKDIKDYNLAKIEITGSIESNKEFYKEYKKVYNNDNIKGVLFIIDSPGGMIGPSIEISYAIKKLTSKKKVIVYSPSLLASGAYYSSIFADEIMVNYGALVGSIGVIFESANFEKLMHKLGIETQIMKHGKYKEIGTPYREWNQDETANLRNLIDKQYEKFVADVREGRGLKDVNEGEFAEARVFTAIEAKKVGLVDKIGILMDAEKELIAMSSVSKAKWYIKDEDKTSELYGLLGGEMLSLFKHKILSML